MLAPLAAAGARAPAGGDGRGRAAAQRRRGASGSRRRVRPTRVWCLEQYFAELARRLKQASIPPRAKVGAEEMTPPHGWFFLARLDGRSVGCGALIRLGADEGEIKRMWTAPDARGLGVARAPHRCDRGDGARSGPDDAQARHQPRAERGAGALSQARLRRNRALQRQSLRRSLVREAAVRRSSKNRFGPRRLRHNRVMGARDSGAPPPCAVGIIGAVLQVAPAGGRSGGGLTMIAALMLIALSGAPPAIDLDTICKDAQAPRRRRRTQRPLSTVACATNRRRATSSGALVALFGRRPVRLAWKGAGSRRAMSNCGPASKCSRGAA